MTQLGLLVIFCICQILVKRWYTMWQCFSYL